MEYIEKRVRQMLMEHKCSFAGVIKNLIKDATDLETVDSHSFLGAMKEFIDTYYDFSSQYNDKRKQL